MKNETFDMDEFDNIIRRAMQGRVEHEVGIDLAAVAMQKADRSVEDAAMVMLARVNRMSRWFTATAIVLIVLITGWAIHRRVAAGGFQSWSTSESTQTTTTTTTGSTTSDFATALTEWMLGGVALSVGAIMIVLCQRAIGSSEDWASWNFQSVRG